MKDSGRFLWLAVGLLLGGAGTLAYLAQDHEARAANDRYDDYIL